MDNATVFRIANVAVLPAWALLVAAPGWKWTSRLVAATLVPGALAIMYGIVFLVGLAHPDPALSSPPFELQDFKAMFQSDQVMLAAWIHFLAFDLFVGAWEVRDSRREGIPHLLVVPCLLVTLMIGPMGFLSYLGLRLAFRKGLALDSAGEGPER